jgi:hypothetical protein
VRSEPFLILFGYRRGRKHLVRVGRKEAWLSREQFRALCTLIGHRLKPAGPPAALAPVLIHRLRKSLGTSPSASLDILGLIETEAKGQYRLGVPSEHFALDHTFERLSGSCVLAPHDFQTLWTTCRKIGHVKSSGIA